MDKREKESDLLLLVVIGMIWWVMLLLIEIKGTQEERRLNTRRWKF